VVKKKKEKIMIVDDNPKNLKLLGIMLTSYGYDVFSFINGEGAYQAAIDSPPDIILLDICMDGLNGYEVCKIFKANKKLENIPVIFLSALSSIEDKIEAFKKGGVDYITKPFQIEEVEARVKTHLKIVEMQKKLEDNNEKLEYMVMERTAELSKAYKKLRDAERVKSEMLNKIYSEFKTPWNSIIKTIDYLFKGNKADVEYSEVEKNKNRIDSIVNDATLLNKIESYEEKPKLEIKNILNIIKTIENTECEEKEENKHIQIKCNEELLKKCIEIVLRFSQKYCSKRRIRTDIKKEKEYILLSFLLEDFFITNKEIFDFIENSKKESEKQNAISYILAERIVKLFNGEIYIEKNEENIAFITLKFPTAGEDNNEKDNDYR
jgi:CheY-like chemotaxis protein